MNNNSLTRSILKKHCRSAKKIELFKNSISYTTFDNKRYVAKKNDNNILEIYNYLNSRGFGYLPRLVFCDTTSYVYEYEKDINTPSEQRINDLIKLDALLHNKTVYYKDISLDEVKEMYEKLKAKISSVQNYYIDLITMIENNVYMSPSEYLLARNCSAIFSCIEFCNKQLDEWYEITSKKSKERIVLLHNNLDTNHLIKTENDNVLISWNKATRNLPIYDFINLYKKYYDKYDFNELYKEYTKRFPLQEEEIKLMYIILFIPEKITFKNSEFESTIEVGKLCNYLFTTDKLFMENEAKNSKVQDGNVNE